MRRMRGGIIDILKDHPGRQGLLLHPFFADIQSAELTREDAAVFLGQWWHPLHYFPVFLSKTVAVVPRQDTKTAVSKILFQELGEGAPARAHERIYIDTMTAAGFSESAVAGAAPFEETRELLAGYAQAAETPLTALGFLYGTEVADLAMVSGIAVAVRRTTGVTRLPWVDIHVVQEPEHVVKATEALAPSFTPDEEREIVVQAARMWQLWIGFFDRLRAELSSQVSMASRPLEQAVS